MLVFLGSETYNCTCAVSKDAFRWRIAVLYACLKNKKKPNTLPVRSTQGLACPRVPMQLGSEGEVAMGEYKEL